MGVISWWRGSTPALGLSFSGVIPLRLWLRRRRHRRDRAEGRSGRSLHSGILKALNKACQDSKLLGDNVELFARDERLGGWFFNGRPFSTILIRSSGFRSVPFFK